jgi:hypothetical protein
LTTMLGNPYAAAKWSGVNPICEMSEPDGRIIQCPPKPWFRLAHPCTASSMRQAFLDAKCGRAWLWNVCLHKQ